MQLLYRQVNAGIEYEYRILMPQLSKDSALRKGFTMRNSKYFYSNNKIMENLRTNVKDDFIRMKCYFVYDLIKKQ